MQRQTGRRNDGRDGMTFAVSVPVSVVVSVIVVEVVIVIESGSGTGSVTANGNGIGIVVVVEKPCSQTLSQGEEQRLATDERRHWLC